MMTVIDANSSLTARVSEMAETCAGMAARQADGFADGVAYGMVLRSLLASHSNHDALRAAWAGECSALLNVRGQIVASDGEASDHSNAAIQGWSDQIAAAGRR